MTTTLAVCLKASWRTDVALRLTDSGKSVRADGTRPGLSAGDAGVLAYAFELQKAWNATERPPRLLVVTVGPEQSDAVLRDALAAGADEVLRIWPESSHGGMSVDLDGSATTTRTKAWLVADVLRPFAQSGTLLVLAGDTSPDEGHAAFGAMLAQALKLDFAQRAMRLTAMQSGWTALVKLERGYTQEVELSASAVVTVASLGLRLPEAPWPAWLASRSAAIPLAQREVSGLSDMGAAPGTVLRYPLPRVKGYRVPDATLPAEARIRMMVGSKPHGGGTLLPASAGIEHQVEAMIGLLKARNYLPDAP